MYDLEAGSAECGIEVRKSGGTREIIEFPKFIRARICFQLFKNFTEINQDNKRTITITRQHLYILFAQKTFSQTEGTTCTIVNAKEHVNYTNIRTFSLLNYSNQV